MLLSLRTVVISLSFHCHTNVRSYDSGGRLTRCRGQRMHVASDGYARPMDRSASSRRYTPSTLIALM